MLTTFRRNWDPTIKLAFYTEDKLDGLEACDQVSVCAFPAWFDRWKARHAGDAFAHGREPSKNRPRCRQYDFKQDCVKFSHKIAAVTDFALWDFNERPAEERAELLIWIDADTLTHGSVDWRWLLSLAAPAGAYMSWLDRQRLYPECSFMTWRTDHPRHVNFMGRLQHTYAADGVFQLAETHDSFVTQKVVEKCVREGWFPTPHSISGEHRKSHHPFPLSELGSRLDHAKGSRKKAGRTPAHEILGKRTEAHWR